MAEISSPIAGGLRIARRTVSAETFTGGQAVASADPATTSLLARNSVALNTVSTQLSSISQQMNALNASIQSVYRNISTNAALERQREIQKQNQERLLAQQQLREGKESLIERKMQSALINPVQRVAAKASFTLSRLMGFFTTLLAGWLLNQGLDAIKAFSEGNRKKLESIKTNVLKTLGIIAGIYVAIRFGLFGVLSAITRVVAKIGTAVATNLFLKPVQLLINGVKSAASWFIKTFKKIVPGFGKPAAAAAAAATTAGVAATSATNATKSGGLIGNVGRGLKGFMRGFGLPLLAGSAATAYDISQGENPGRAIAGATTGTAGSVLAGGLGSLLPIPGASFFSGALAYQPSSDFGKGIYDKFFGKTPKNPKKASGAKTTPTSRNNTQDFSQPPQYGELNAPADTKTSESSAASAPTLTKDQQDGYNQATSALQGPFAGMARGQVADYYNQMTPDQKKTFKDYLGTRPQSEQSLYSFLPDNKPQIESMQSATTQEKIQSISPVPEPPPVAIPLPMQQSAPPKQSASMPRSGGAANNVPAIASSNPDNFYTLYSQIHYNVVAV